jgi:hypothetical protein
MSADAIALLLTAGFCSGLTIFSVFMFFFAMTPPLGESEFSPSPYQPMDMLLSRRAPSKSASTRESHGAVEIRQVA